MSHRIGVNLLAATALLLALSLAADVDAGKTGPKAKARAPRQNTTFSLSTNYTGYIGETLQIGRVRYTVAPDASLYVIGEGAAPLGKMVLNRYLYIAGERSGNSFVVRTIIVRPAATDTEAAGQSGTRILANDPMPPR